MLLVEVFKNQPRTFSFEVFPAKTPEGHAKLLETLKGLCALKPDFISCTYGAGGGSREKTLDIVEHIQKSYDIAAMAHKRDPRALAAFEEYAQIMAIALHNYAVMFAPEIVVFTGSFAATADLFIDSTKEHLEKLLVRRRIGFDLMPKLKVSKLDNMAGLVGAAKVAFDRSGSPFGRIAS